MDTKNYKCVKSHGRDVLMVRPSHDNENVIFRGGRKGEELQGVDGLDVYVGGKELEALIEQLQSFVDAEPDPIEYEESLQCDYSGDELLVEHTKGGVLPQFNIASKRYGELSASVFLDEQSLLDLRMLIDLSLEKIEASDD